MMHKWCSGAFAVVIMAFLIVTTVGVLEVFKRVVNFSIQWFGSM